ncbi:MAG TPA: hypothetical protein VEY67_05225, partial [Candidatus Dormibacteraeota bacterium]|nr:hypothetical protein [Candidatus Dormibacteraeota bacterium]
MSVQPVATLAHSSVTAVRPLDLRPVRVFVAALLALLAGYMFLGRGFAHVGGGQLYVGEVVLALGIAATANAMWRLRLRPRMTPLTWLLVAFMILGALRTIPYLAQYRADALRDGSLWGYGLFALMVFVLADRDWLVGAMRTYGRVVPVFAVWLPISYWLFTLMSVGENPATPGSNIPLVFFKNQDMAVHSFGSLAALVLGMTYLDGRLGMLVRALVAIPLS